jgi:hypothetical protein
MPKLNRVAQRSNIGCNELLGHAFATNQLLTIEL